MNDLPRKVEKFIIDNQLIPDNSRVIIGVSGGADSLALLLILHSLREKYGLEIIAAHLNHMLRGNQADEDAAFVKHWCEKLNLDFKLRKCDIALIAEHDKTGVEAAGRNERRRFFSDLVNELAAEGFCRENIRVALAHHQDDQAESMLLHLGRGSGLDGLVGMQPRNGVYIRPLLEQPRKEIEKWLRKINIAWRTDITNSQPVTTRNRLRHHVLPAWREAIGYNPAPALARTAGILREDQVFLMELARKEYGKIHDAKGLRLAPLRRLAPALANRVIRLYWAENNGGPDDLGMVHLDSLRAIIDSQESDKQIMLPRKWKAFTTGNYLHLEKNGRIKVETAANIPGEGISLRLPGVNKIPEMNLLIEANLIENESEIVYNNAMECFRIEEIIGCRLRYRLPGDRIHPTGRNCGKSLKNFFSERKIPAAERGRIPLLAIGSEVAWIPGHASGKGIARPGDGRKGQIICLKMSRLVEE